MNQQAKIQVIIRKRPVSKKEQQKNDPDIIEVLQDNSLIVRELKQKVDLTKYIEQHHFNFDGAYGENSTNEQIYQSKIRPLIEAAFQQFKVSIFAYGQTGSGKTYTMLGDIENRVAGLYLLASYDIFNFLQRPEFQHLSCWVSFYEIYCGKLFDLLNNRSNIVVREDQNGQINIVGLQEKRITSIQSLMQFIEFGLEHRITGVNSANTDSSRSHAILQINLRDGENVFGKMSFIDLAGNERGADVSIADKKTRIDGAEISKSLLALKECIRALDQNKNHLPFRGSKLTLVLKDSFVGNCRTVMIGNICPCQGQSETTLNTLRYADRVKELKKPRPSSDNLTNADLLSQQLMLPRQDKNTVRYNLQKPNQFSQQQNGQKIMENQTHRKNSKSPQRQINLQPYMHISKKGENFLNVEQQLYDTGSNQQYYTSNSHRNIQNQKYKSQMNSSNSLIQQQNQNNRSRSKSPGLYNFSNTQNTGRFTPKGYVNNNFMPNNQQQNYGQLQLQNQQQIQNLPYFASPNNNRNKSEHQSRNDLNSTNDPSYNNNNSNNDFGTPNKKQYFSINQQSPYVNNNNKLNMTSMNSSNGNLYNNSNNLSTQIQKQQMTPSRQHQLQQSEEQQQYMTEIDKNIVYLQNLDAKNESELYGMNQKHEQLIGMILSEEEDVINSHRTHVDETMEVVRGEMSILQEVDQPKSDIDDYLNSLEGILNHKIELINNLKDKVLTFKRHLHQEEQLNKRFQNRRDNLLSNNNILQNDVNSNNNRNSISNQNLSYLNNNFNNNNNLNTISQKQLHQQQQQQPQQQQQQQQFQDMQLLQDL